jgi:DnaJ-class molecular chaperone
MGKPTPRSSILTRIFAATNRLGDVLFARSDARARDCGWEVGRSRSGLHRSYRDPRFDLLHRCVRCNGSGRNPHGSDCARCYGTGRIVHHPRRREAG